MPSFYNGKRFFLTYPQCQASPEELLEFLRDKAQVASYVVAREQHQDGNYHLHACVEFVGKQTHGTHWLDFIGKHPNKQDPRNWDACKTYCKKDGDFITSEEDIQIIPRAAPLDLCPLCEEYDSEEQWMSYCCEAKIGFQYAQWAWNRMHGDFSTVIGDDHPGVVVDRLARYDFIEDGKCLILKGETGTGKTTWAKKNIPKPALFVSHVDELKVFRIGYHKSIIFDDVDFNHYPRTSQIALVDFDNPRQIHCRHSCARIPAGVFKVFTCNADPLLLTDEAIRRRCRVVNV